MADILIIEDNAQLQKYLCEYLQAYSFTSYVLEDYSEVADTLLRVAPKLVLLDINLPAFDGFYYLKQIRKVSQVPVIILSARSEEAEQIRGIEGGAHDYITKPFSAGVLVAKVTALLSRARVGEGELRVGDVTLSKSTLSLSRGDAVVGLSKNEYKIMALLLARVGQYVSREEILEVLWDDTVFVDDNTLTVNMTRVKKKLAEIGLTHVIKTKRGVGYAFDRDS